MSLLGRPISPADRQALLGALPDAVLTTDTNGKVEFLNRAAERLTGHPAETAVGRPLNEVFPLGHEVSGLPIECPAAATLETGKAVAPFAARLLGGGDAGRCVLRVSAAPIREPDGPITGTILVARDVTRERELVRQMSHRASHDALTGLVNRAEFEHRLQRALASSAETGTEHALEFLDLDGFKRVNDSCGHQAGDELLRELGTILRGQIRGRDTVARLGGDEFGILLEHCNPPRAVRVAEQVRKAISEHRFVCGSSTYGVGASIGIVPVLRDGGSPTDLLRLADAACYQAKRRGGNQVQLGNLHGTAASFPLPAPSLQPRPETRVAPV